MTVPESTPDQLAAELRAWAKGTAAVEAAVELLVRHRSWLYWLTYHQRRFGQAIDRTPGGTALRWHRLAEAGQAVAATNSEHRVLRIACSIGGNNPATLGADLDGLGEVNLRLVLAAIAHANGCREIFPFPEEVEPW